MLPNAEMLRTDGPNPLGSRAYARDLAEVKSLGLADEHHPTADQTMAASFWQAQPGAVRRRDADVSERYGLSTAENARLFAMAGLAAADAAIACWNDQGRCQSV